MQLSEHDSDDDDDEDISEDDESEDLGDADNGAGTSSRAAGAQAAAAAAGAAPGRPTSIRSGHLQPRPHHAPTAAQQGLGPQHAQLHHHHAGPRSHAGGRKGRHPRHPPNASELAQLRRDFLSEMESRFLLGQDGGHGVDYGTIDADASLDGDWLAQEERDAEDKYFDED